MRQTGKKMTSGNSSSDPQRVTVFQQQGSGERKIAGVRKYAGEAIVLEIISIDDDLPELIDDSTGLLPEDLQTDLVIDFLTHQDLSLDLAELCSSKGIPIVASGKKINNTSVLTPPT